MAWINFIGNASRQARRTCVFRYGTAIRFWGQDMDWLTDFLLRYASGQTVITFITASGTTQVRTKQMTFTWVAKDMDWLNSFYGNVSGQTEKIIYLLIAGTTQVRAKQMTLHGQLKVWTGLTVLWYNIWTRWITFITALEYVVRTKQMTLHG